MLRTKLPGLAILLAFALYATTAVAQTSPPLVVRVHVADSAGVPVAGADVSVMRGLNQVLAHGQTDARGDQSFTVPRTGFDDELVVRKIGFQRVSRFFPDSAHPIAFAIGLTRSVRSLDTVKVAAAEDVRRKSYYIDAEAIENSPRFVIDALDVVMKLRPDMIWGRSGLPDGLDQHVSNTRISRNGMVTRGGAAVSRSAGGTVKKALEYGYCPPLANIWVNGAWIHDIPPTNAIASLKRTSNNAVFINTSLASILASIKPEHIAEMEYHPCTDEAAEPKATNALMVQLKDGIAYEPGYGSFVAAGFAPPRAPSPTTSAVLTRILGVFDDETGDPLVDVEVIDVASGTIARTTSTGTVSLSFLPAGESQLKIQRAGFAPRTLPVTISPADTTPVTIVLARAKSAPAPKLLEIGGIDRR